MNIILTVTILILGLIFEIFLIKLLVNKKMSERNSFLWFFGSIIVLVLSLVPKLLDTLAKFIGISYPPALLFLVSILFLFAVVLNQSIQISILNDRIKDLAQKLAIDEFRIDNENK